MIFSCLLRRRRVVTREIKSIKSDGQIGFLVVKIDAGKIGMLNQFDELHNFITRLKTANPAVELRVLKFFCAEKA